MILQDFCNKKRKRRRRACASQQHYEKRNYHRRAGVLTRFGPCNCENASQAQGIWPSASTLRTVTTLSSDNKVRILAINQWYSSTITPSLLYIRTKTCRTMLRVGLLSEFNVDLDLFVLNVKTCQQYKPRKVFVSYRCFLTNEFHICIICFSSLVTSTKSSSIYIDAKSISVCHMPMTRIWNQKPF